MRKTLALFSLLLCAAPAFAESEVVPKRDLFIVLFEPGPGWVEGKPMSEQDLRAHAVYHSTLVREGRAFTAGGFVGMDGGMAIIRARDLNDAQEVIAADPAIKNGVFKAQLRLWLPRFVSAQPLVDVAP